MMRPFLVMLILAGVGCSSFNTLSETQTDPRFYALRNAALADRGEATRLINKDPSIVHVRNSVGETPFHFLVVENALEAVSFLVEKGADINSQNALGDSALCEAMSLGYYDMVDLLLRLGADGRAEECFGPKTTASLQVDQFNRFKKIYTNYGYTIPESAHPGAPGG
jgi:ankyrin repeat protein